MQEYYKSFTFCTWPNWSKDSKEAEPERDMWFQWTVQGKLNTFTILLIHVWELLWELWSCQSRDGRMCGGMTKLFPTVLHPHFWRLTILRRVVLQAKKLCRPVTTYIYIAGWWGARIRQGLSAGLLYSELPMQCTLENTFFFPSSNQKLNIVFRLPRDLMIVSVSEVSTGVCSHRTFCLASLILSDIQKQARVQYKSVCTMWDRLVYMCLLETGSITKHQMPTNVQHCKQTLWKIFAYLFSKAKERKCGVGWVGR